MIWIWVFLTLTVVEGVYIWLRWDKISQVINIGKFTHDLFGDQLKQIKKFQKTMGFKEKIIFFFLRYKKLIWLPIIILLIINGVVASIFSAICSIISVFA